MQIAKQNKTKKTKKASDWEICGTTTYLLRWISQQWDVETHWWAFSVQISPYTGWDLTGRDVRLRAWEMKSRSLCTDWSFKLGCFILGAYSKLRSSGRLCQKVLKVGPLVFRRYAFVFGCFPRAPVILLGALYTFLPTLVLVVANRIS